MIGFGSIGRRRVAVGWNGELVAFGTKTVGRGSVNVVQGGADGVSDGVGAVDVGWSNCCVGNWDVTIIGVDADGSEVLAGREEEESTSAAIAMGWWVVLGGGGKLGLFCDWGNG